MFKDLQDFFKEAGGKYSMSRLVFFMSLFPASWHIVKTGQDVMTYITTYAGAYLGSKHGGSLIDAIGNKNEKEEIQDKAERE